MHVESLPYSPRIATRRSIAMPVHLAFDRHHRAALDPAAVLLGEKDLDRLLDSKGCHHRHPSSAVFRHLEPVCCCERCYAFLANPIIAKLSAEDGRWGSDEALVSPHGEDVLLTGEWFSLCPWADVACDCGKDCHRICDDDVKERSETTLVISDESPPLLKKRMTADKSSTDGDTFVTGARRPLVDLQRGVITPRPPPPSDALKRPDTFHPARGGGGPPGGGWSTRGVGDEARSWVQPPPNRTICHIVDDVTLERLTAASSPVLTRCCVTSSSSSSSSSARKQGTSRNVGGKTKAKNQCVSR